ncbi:MAG: glycosyltransferase family 4 protein [Coprococcus sp.]|nr:glycosyltransferase family 4 protein [Coprococcus sp.]
MKILSITAQKPDSTGSGVYLTELVKGFSQMGIEQAVVAGVYKEDLPSFPQEVKVFPVYFMTEELNFPIAGMSDEMPYQSTRYCDMTEDMTERFRKVFTQQVESVMEEFAPDVILCHHLYFLTSLVRELCPEMVVCGICHGSDLRQIKKNPWQREFIRTQIRKLDKIFTLHEEQRQEICDWYGCGGGQAVVIGTGYNSSIFYREKRERKAKKDKLGLIFAGKIAKKKGVVSLIRALGRLPDARDQIRLSLAGGYGNEEEYALIHRIAKQSPYEVRFLGKLTQQELASEMNRNDIFVLPSFYEGLPLVIIEALACGLRAVCTDLPGIRFWLEENVPGNGVVFVEPPRMRYEDEPVEEDLPLFERRLAEAVQKAEQVQLPGEEVLRKISWFSLCRRIRTELSNDLVKKDIDKLYI